MDGNNLSSLSTSLRMLKDQVNDTLSDIVTKEKSTSTGDTVKTQGSSESELSEGKRVINEYAQLFLRAPIHR